MHPLWNKGRFLRNSYFLFSQCACASLFILLFIDIVPKPNILCNQPSIPFHSNKGKVECKIQNYSQYVNMSLVKNDITVVKEYPASNVCVQIVTEDAAAMCTVYLGDGQYKICVSYNNSVTHASKQPQCSDKVHINISKFFFI